MKTLKDLAEMQSGWEERSIDRVLKFLREHPECAYSATELTGVLEFSYSRLLMSLRKLKTEKKIIGKKVKEAEYGRGSFYYYYNKDYDESVKNVE